jgi:hypothetical protein
VQDKVQRAFPRINPSMKSDQLIKTPLFLGAEK